MIRLMDKIYKANQIDSLNQDIQDYLDPLYNAAVVAIPEDELGRTGFFRVRIDWQDD